ncbi:YbaB/EbfC family nucleoid-associated protein [Rickettsiales bacterium LUAb2]
MMPNLSGLLQKAGKIQQKLGELEKELETMEFEGSAGGSLVKVKLKGNGNISTIDFDDSLFKEEEKAVLSDLIAAAYNDAKRNLDNIRKEKMQSITGGLPLPPGLGF